jgi:hypothetical protein
MQCNPEKCYSTHDFAASKYKLDLETQFHFYVVFFPFFIEGIYKIPDVEQWLQYNQYNYHGKAYGVIYSASQPPSHSGCTAYEDQNITILITWHSYFTFNIYATAMKTMVHHCVEESKVNNMHLVSGLSNIHSIHTKETSIKRELVTMNGHTV